jgi:hypothetical protein
MIKDVCYLLAAMAVTYMAPVTMLYVFPVYDVLWDQDNYYGNGSFILDNCTEEFNAMADWAREVHGYVILSTFISFFYAAVLTVGMLRMYRKKYEVVPQQE